MCTKHLKILLTKTGSHLPIFRKDDKSVLFIHIPKTAGTSIETAFENSGWTLEHFHAPARGHGPDKKPCNPQHWHQPLLSKHIYQPTGRLFYEFTVVRNPFTRMISEFLWKDNSVSGLVSTSGFDDQFFTRLEKFGITNMRKQLTVSADYNSAPVDFIKRGKKFHADNHWCPQVEYFRGTTRRYKYENLQSVIWPDLKTKFDLDILTQQYTKVELKKSRPEYHDGFSDTFKDLYTELYKQDHKVLDYPLPF